jgi:hypothetical protein
MLARFFRLVGCALLWWGATSIQAQPFSLQSTPAGIARWMYPFNASSANRATAPLFSAFSSIPDFDTRDGQYLLGWDTSNSIPVGQGARNYLLSRLRVTLTISANMQYVYDGTLHDYRTYLLTNAPNYLPATNLNNPVELYGVGFRGGFINSSSVYVSYSATNFPQAGPFFATSNGGDYTNRVAYDAGYNTNGVLVDVSDNVGDNGTNEIPQPFEVAPFAVGYSTNVAPGQLMPEGSQITFDINLNDPLIYNYIQQGLNEGNLSFMASSLVNADSSYFDGQPNWPEFYTIFSVLADPDQYPQLQIEGTVVRTNLDSDLDGLPDDWEQFYFGQLGAGATHSSEGDGISNLAKYIAGTNPTNTATDFRLLPVQKQSGQTELRFNSAPGRQYSVQWSADLQHWQTVTNPAFLYLSDWLTKTGINVVYPAPVYAAWRDTNATDQQRFYRLSVQ